MLFLFDIDATMTDTGGRGVRAMEDAGRELFGAFSVEGVSFAGSLDTVLTTQLFALNNVAGTPANIASFRAAYARHLARRLAEPNAGRALPGVHEILNTLHRRDRSTLGVLTGNFEDTGTMKLRACAIDPEWFDISVYADHVPHDDARPARREHLVALGLERYAAKHRRRLTPAHAVVIGDTPHDIACGKAHNTRTLGVATGRFTTADLAAAGADLAVESLAEVDRIVSWLIAR
jgi:phosphoglycolate phosphatase-like HAD superfamily hydrolase